MAHVCCTACKPLLFPTSQLTTVCPPLCPCAAPTNLVVDPRLRLVAQRRRRRTGAAGGSFSSSSDGSEDGDCSDDSAAPDWQLKRSKSWDGQMQDSGPLGADSLQLVRGRGGP